LILPNMFWYLIKGHNIICFFIWLVTFHWTTFLFVITQLCKNSILNEGCEYLHVFELKVVQESFTLIHIVKKTMLHQKVPSLPWLVFTSLVNIGINHILELNQWNHANALMRKKSCTKLSFTWSNSTDLGGWNKIDREFHLQCTKQETKIKQIKSKKGLEFWNP
jgi:hypothetical protein